MSNGRKKVGFVEFLRWWILDHLLLVMYLLQNISYMLLYVVGTQFNVSGFWVVSCLKGLFFRRGMGRCIQSLIFVVSSTNFPPHNDESIALSLSLTRINLSTINLTSWFLCSTCHKIPESDFLLCSLLLWTQCPFCSWILTEFLTTFFWGLNLAKRKEKWGDCNSYKGFVFEKIFWGKNFWNCQI